MSFVNLAVLVSMVCHLFILIYMQRLLSKKDVLLFFANALVNSNVDWVGVHYRAISSGSLWEACSMEDLPFLTTRPEYPKGMDITQGHVICTPPGCYVFLR